MAHYKFKLNLDIPKEYPARAPEVVGTCHDSDGLYNCNCILSRLREHQGPESCEFFGRPIEPLAFYLPPYSEVQQQKQSPLYGVLPKEVRNMIMSSHSQMTMQSRPTMTTYPDGKLAQMLMFQDRIFRIHFFRLAKLYIWRPIVCRCSSGE